MKHLIHSVISLFSLYYVTANALTIDANSNNAFVKVTTSSKKTTTYTNIPKWRMNSLANNILVSNWGVELTLDATEYGFIPNEKSSIMLEINGNCVNTECDLSFGFGSGDKYFTVLAAMDGSVNTMVSKGGFFTYPGCGNKLSDGDVANLLNNINTGTNFYSLRRALSGGDANNYKILSSKANANKWPILIEIINDDKNKATTFLWESPSLTLLCVFTESFPVNKNIVFNVINDYSEVTDIYWIDIASSTASFSSTTPYPTGPKCELGGNPGYYFNGVPAIVSGDPHFRIWNGNNHDFMGSGDANQQFYYMHPCKDFSRDEMPFTMLGRHVKISKNSGITKLDYITLELFDTNDDVYLIWLSSTKHKWILKDINTDTLYHSNIGTNLVSNNEIKLGERFKILFIQRNGDRIDFRLSIGSCSLVLYMKPYYLQVQPPQCYKCYTCGLFGDFKIAKSSGTIQRMRRCDNGLIQYRDGVSRPEAYDINAWTWQRQYLISNCHYWSITRRLQDNHGSFINDDEDESDNNYIPIVPDDFVYIDPCNSTVLPIVKNECESARNNISTCCELIGEPFCDKLQIDCEIDACIIFSGNINKTITIKDIVIELFIQSIELVCTLPNASNQEDENNLVPIQGAPTWKPSITPTIDPTIEPTIDQTIHPTIKNTENLTDKANIYCLISVAIPFITLSLLS